MSRTGLGFFNTLIKLKQHTRPLGGTILNLGLFENTEVVHCYALYKALIRNFRMAYESFPRHWYRAGAVQIKAARLETNLTLYILIDSIPRLHALLCVLHILCLKFLSIISRFSSHYNPIRKSLSYKIFCW